MPVYLLRHVETGEEREIRCSYDERERHLSENKEWVNIIGGAGYVPYLGDYVGGKKNRNWNEVKKKIKAGSGAGNTIKTA